MVSKSKYGNDKFVEVDGYQLHYVDVGQGKPVLMIPGSMSTYRVWDRLVPLLFDRYRLLPLDYLGTGDSDKPKNEFKYTIEEQTDVLAKMVVKLQLAPVHIIGASYGGAIAMSLGYRFPELVGAVVSIEGSVVKPKSLPGSNIQAMIKYPLIGDAFILLIRSGLMNRLVMRLVAGKWYPYMTPEDRRWMLAMINENSRSATRHAWYYVLESAIVSRDMQEEAKTLKVPVLYIYGTDTDLMPMIQDNLAFFEKYLPDVRVAAIQDGIHDSAYQKPQEVATLIRDFLG